MSSTSYAGCSLPPPFAKRKGAYILPPSRTPCHSEHSEESLMFGFRFFTPLRFVQNDMGGHPPLLCRFFGLRSFAPLSSVFLGFAKGAAPPFPPSHSHPCHSERSEESPPSWNVRGLGGCSASCCLPPHLPAHPPLTSLRSFAPLSSVFLGFAKGAYTIPPLRSVRGLGGCLINIFQRSADIRYFDFIAL